MLTGRFCLATFKFGPKDQSITEYQGVRLPPPPSTNDGIYILRPCRCIVQIGFLRLWKVGHAYESQHAMNGQGSQYDTFALPALRSPQMKRIQCLQRLCCNRLTGTKLNCGSKVRTWACRCNNAPTWLNCCTKEGMSCLL